jgi:hypothetical protein
MKIIDSKGRLFGKVSIIDILVLLVIVAVIAGVYILFIKNDNTPLIAKSDKILTVFYTEEVHSFVKDSIKIGDQVRDRVTNAYFGKVVKVETGNSVSFGVNSAGEVIQSPKDGFISIKIFVEGDGVYSDADVRFGSYIFYSNRPFEVRFGKTALWTRIIGFDKMD